MRKSLFHPIGSSPALCNKRKQPVGSTEERDHAWYEGLTQDQYDHYYKIAWNVTYLIVGHPHEADIVADKAMDSLWEREHPPSKAEVETHLRVLARSRALDCLASPMHRLRARCRSLIQKDDDEEEYETISEAHRPVGAEEQFFYEEERKLFAQRFAQALTRLNDLQRACFVLRFVEHMKPEEVAETLKVPVNTVYTQTYRARNKVAKLLIDRG